MKKRVLMIFLIAVFMIAFSYAQSITVTNPHSGSTWYKGNTYNITWTKSGSMDNNVKITLYKPDHTTLQMIIVRPTANDGIFSWVVSNSIPDGQYIVRVKTMDNAVYDDSVVFNIATPAPTGGTITVTDPHSGDCWKKGSSHTITWTKSGSMNDSVKITLYKTDLTTLQTIIVNPTANDGAYTWVVPNSIPEGSYVVRVKTVDNTVYDDSDIFSISNNCDSGIPSIDFGRFRASLNLAELAIYMHGPGPRIRGIGGIKNALEKSNIKQPVTIKLMKGREVIYNFGVFRPMVKRGGVFFNSMPSMFDLRLTPKQKEMMGRNPRGYKLVVFSGKNPIGEKELKVKGMEHGRVYNNSLITTINPKILQNARLTKKCPDLAVVDIKFSIVRKYSQFRGKVRITGVVKNVGNADYISHPNQQMIVMDMGDPTHPLKTKNFQNLKAGETITINYEMDWNSSSPNEGEFPPTFKVYLTYDPDIGADNLKTNDDCNPNNNSMSKSGKAINDMLK